MSNIAENPYGSEQAAFWTKKGDECTVVGDYLVRLPALELLHSEPPEHILDAGCGAGWLARKIVLTRSSRVWGCDASDVMIAAAKEVETRRHHGIEYDKADITKHLPYKARFFDGVVCTGVVIHFTPEEVRAFLAETQRVLAIGGRIVVSIFSSELFGMQGTNSWEKQNSTAKDEWVSYHAEGCLTEKQAQMRSSRQYEETYRDVTGAVFKSAIWFHPINDFVGWMEEAGLTVTRVQDQYITRQVLETCKQKGRYGYPAYHIIEAFRYE